VLRPANQSAKKWKKNGDTGSWRSVIFAVRVFMEVKEAGLSHRSFRRMEKPGSVQLLSRPC
jgi:hypothetical protein